MSEKVIPIEERVPPMTVSDNVKGVNYELDFSRESVRFAEARGFAVEDVTRFPVTKVPELFFYAFRKNHKNLAKSQTDALLERMKGLTGPALERLIQLYNQAALTHLIATDEDDAKNAEVTVEL